MLHQTQDFSGFLPAEVQELIAECLHIPTAKVYGRLTPADVKGIVDEYRNME